jgi:hypothetical protein
LEDVQSSLSSSFEQYLTNNIRIDKNEASDITQDNSSDQSNLLRKVYICVSEQQNSDFDIREFLPKWKSLDSLQSTSQRVVESIEQGFKITKLESALKIAIQKGDQLAAQKIRAEINRLLNTDDSSFQ